MEVAINTFLDTNSGILILGFMLLLALLFEFFNNKPKF